MTIVGFEQTSNGQIREYLPKNEQLASENEQRQMFLHMFNAYVDEEMRLSKKEMLDGQNIYEVFRNKIEKMLFTPCILQGNTPRNIVNIACIPSRSINVFVQGGYEKQEKYKKIVNPKAPLKQISKLIDLVYNNKECKLLCNLDDMFLHLVYERVKLVNKQNKVLLFDKTIVIQDRRKDVSPTLLIPAYTKIDKNNLYDEPIISHHMQTVLSTLKETQIRQIFLVYPKHPEFKKHVSIKLLDKIPLGEDEYRVKVIPYSFSFCIKNQKKTTHTRRQKCQ
ncbi:MAG: hypothetical protein E3J96_01045 [Sulfurovum sp.]|nr:MAG: hypothetical protein E3J96_01045 [Sulfurovum sp.]